MEVKTDRAIFKTHSNIIMGVTLLVVVDRYQLHKKDRLN